MAMRVRVCVWVWHLTLISIQTIMLNHHYAQELKSSK